MFSTLGERSNNVNFRCRKNLRSISRSYDSADNISEDASFDTRSNCSSFSEEIVYQPEQMLSDAPMSRKRSHNTRSAPRCSFKRFKSRSSSREGDSGFCAPRNSPSKCDSILYSPISHTNSDGFYVSSRHSSDHGAAMSPIPPSSPPSTTTSPKKTSSIRRKDFEANAAAFLDKYERLPLEYWERSDACKEAKFDHLDRLDRLWPNREDLVLLTTLAEDDTVLERNMFPYETPDGVEHFTLWSVQDLTHDQICHFVNNWLHSNLPQVRRWDYDDNSGERSIALFHVHVFVETKPYCFVPSDKAKTYVPTHAAYKQSFS